MTPGNRNIGLCNRSFFSPIGLLLQGCSAIGQFRGTASYISQLEVPFCCKYRLSERRDRRLISLYEVRGLQTCLHIVYLLYILRYGRFFIPAFEGGFSTI
uniref:Uncharacterized protein n=1 Tax=Anguilla anguilla TaxID=7936 RepID=A0A0E9WV75_ANGAN